MADENDVQYTKEDIDRALANYYDMKCRSLVGLSTLINIPLEILEQWNKTYNWPAELKKRDYHYGRDTYSRIRKQTVRQQDCIDKALYQIETGEVTDIHAIAKLVTSINDTRNSLLKERQYDELQQQLQTSSGNEELLNKLNSLKKDMKELGINGITFDGSDSIIEGEGESDGSQL